MLELASFCSGAMIMALEMTGARVMAPYLGSSVIIWTSIIGVMLAFMSLGYWLGGRLSDRRPEPRVLAYLLLACGASVLLTALIQRPLLEFISSAEFLGLHLAAISAAILLFALPSTLLGMVSPFFIRLKLQQAGTKAEESGGVIGRFYALSTLGSIVGTFLGGFVLISYVGSSETLFGLSAGIFILPALIWRPSLKVVAAGTAVCLLAAFVSFSLIRASEQANGHRDIDTAYGHLRIDPAKDQRGNKLLTMRTDPGFWQSAMYSDAPFALVLPYTKFYDLPFLYAPESRKILMLGGGAYSVPKHLLSHSGGKYQKDPWPGTGFALGDLSIDVVEIDPGITKAAKEYFKLPDDPRLKIVHQDARYFLNVSQGKKYDLIFGDTFSSCYYIPFQMSTVETAKLVHERLDDSGICMINSIGAISGPKSRLSKAIARSYSQVFPRVELFVSDSLNDPEMMQNIMIMAFKNPDMQIQALPNLRLLRVYTESRIEKPELENAALLTDNFAPVEQLMLPLLGR